MASSAKPPPHPLPRPSRLVVEELEPRILFSADAAALLALGGDAGLAHQRVLEVAPLAPSPQMAQTSQSPARDIVFVDARVTDVLQLVDELAQQRPAGASFDIVVLDSRQDGVQQISDVLAHERGLAAVHIISHGAAGEMQLGSSSFDSQRLMQDAAAVAAWGQALTSDGDLLLYGCDVAAGDSGALFIRQLAQLTQADVAASTNRSGSAALGADWTLEAHTGGIEAGVLLGASSTWQGSLGLSPVGGETRVNGTTSGTQDVTPYGGGAVAMDAAGNQVVVFVSDAAGTPDIIAQRFNAAGVAQGAAITVNSTSSDQQYEPSVAMAADGRFVVSWSSLSQDGSGYGVYARSFAADGTASSGEVRVNSATIGNQSLSRVAMGDAGHFVVAFTDNNVNSGDIVAQRFDVAAIAQGSNFRVNSTTIGAQAYPDIAMRAADGSFVIVWDSSGQDGSNAGVYGQRFDAAGIAQGGEFQIHVNTTGDQQSGKVSYAADGSFVVAWESNHGVSFEFLARRFDAAGGALTGEITLNTNGTGIQWYGDVQSLADGGFVATWQSSGQDGAGWGIYAQQLSASGAKLGSELLVNTTTSGEQISPSVAVAGDKAAVVWSGNGTGDASGVFMQRLALPGITVTPAYALHTSEGGGSAQFSVVLNNAPTADVTVPLAVTDSTEGSLSVSSLTFTAANWSTPQVVTVTGVDDALADGYQPYSVLVGAASSSDASYHGLDGDDVRLANGDNDITYGLITVNTTSDGVDGDVSSLAALAANPGADQSISLREALLATNNTANGTGGADRIVFNIAGSGVQTINVGAVQLPEVTDAVWIDGQSQSGFAGTPLIELNGGNNTNRSGVAFGVGSSGSLLSGFIINRFQYSGVEIHDTSNITVQGNWIGLNAAGNAAAANGDNGIYAYNSTGLFIGGSTAAQRNVVSGNVNRGIYFLQVTDSVISGNFVGSDVGGTGDVNGGSSNGSQTGVLLAAGSNNNLIGGTTADARNLLSGNNHFGMEIHFGAANNLVQGNYIGTTVSGQAALGNSNGGFSFWNAGTGNVLGGGAAGAGNVISGNTGVGLQVANASSGAVVQGNLVGLAADGVSALGNGNSGIGVWGGSLNTLIGTDANGNNDSAERNVVAANTYNGIYVDGAGTTGTAIRGNFVGTDANGNTARGNTGNGVALYGGTGTVLGGTLAGSGNLISGNGDNGVILSGSASTGALVQGNVIGLNANQTAALANNSQGLWIGSATSGHHVLGNVISGNQYSAVVITGAGTTGVKLAGNFIGTTAGGSGSFGNGAGVVIFDGASNNTIGGTAAGAGNVIAHSVFRGSAVGVSVTGSGNGNAVLGNSIYGNAALGLDLGTSGVTPNDNGDGNTSDADTGPNNLQNFPVLGSAQINSAGQLVVTGLLQSNSNSHFRIEFFANAPGSADASGHGEAQVYLGFANVSTDANGRATFTTTLAASNSVGQLISATTTRSNSSFTSFTDTSEFARNLTVTALPVNTVPGAQTTNEDTALVIAGISVAQADAGNGALEVTLAVDHGVLSLSTITGLGFVVGDGTADASITFRGRLPDINAALNNLTFTPASNYNGPARLSLSTLSSKLLDLKIDSSLKGRYAFDSSGSLGADSSPLGANAGVVTGGTAATDGQRGRVLNLDGTGGVQINGRFGDSANVSLAAWVHLNVADTRGAEVISLGDNVHLRLDNGDGLTGVFFDGTNFNVTSFDVMLVGAGWHHVAFVVDGTLNTTSLYLDGSLVAGSSTTTSIAYSRGAFTEIGRHGRGDPDFGFNGLIDDARIYTRAISAEEVQALATDLRQRDSDAVAITVTAVNNAPVITSNGGGASAAINIAENTSAVTTVTSSDVDGGAPLYSIAGGADAAKFTINASTGVLAFISAPDYEVPIDAGGNNIYDVTVQVSDGNGGVATQAMAVTVTDVSSQLVVTTTADSNDTGLGSSFTAEQLNANKGTDGAVSLREAIIAANNTANAYDVISFNLAGPGVHTIAVGATALPTITGAVIVDGWSQPTFGSTPLIELTGNGAGSAISGLTLGVGSSGSTVRGLIINGFSGSGVEINGSGYHTLQGNWIGLNAAGNAASANGDNGIYADNSSGLLIGGSTAAQRNVVSGNVNGGIKLVQSSNSVIAGNYVGTDAAGLADVNGAGNSSDQSGVWLDQNSNGNTVGGTSAAAGNVISGNNHFGVEIAGGAQNNLIQGNTIGIAANGLTALGNSSGGVTFWAAGTGNVLGGGTAGAGNVVAGNAGYGVHVANGSQGTVIQGNVIGLLADGSTRAGNGFSGVVVTDGATNTLIGTDANGSNDAVERNIISGNLDDGVGVFGASTTGTLIRGNYIGTDASGLSARGNGSNGVAIYGGATNNVVGGTAAGAGNVISSNVENAVIVFGAGSNNNVVQGNLIGLNANQSAVLGNTREGVWIGLGASNNLVGGTTAGAGNVIAGSGYSGVQIFDAASTGNAVLGNSIRGSGFLGIDLGGDGVTLNDTGDADTGANNLQNLPLLGAALINGAGQLVLTGTLNSTANSQFRIEFFANAVGTADASGFGEGQTYLGFVNVSTDASGNASFNTTLAVSVTSGQSTSATATKSNATFTTFGDTSEFARNVPVMALPVNTVPGAQTTNEDTALVFSTANGNAIRIADADAGGANNQVTLTAAHGSFTLSGVTGLVFLVGDGTADASIVMVGSASAINAALDGLIYTPELNYNGPAQITIETLDHSAVGLNTDSALLARYSFNNVANLGVDTSPGAANNGINAGGVAVADLVRGDVLGLAGGTHVQVLNGSASTSQTTLAAWVYLDLADPNGSSVVNIDGVVGFRLDGGGGMLGYYRDSATGWQYTQSSVNVAGTGWRHVAYTVDHVAHTQTLYIDGVVVASTNHTEAVLGNAGLLNLGYNYLDASLDFNGKMDEARVYNRALTPAEIRMLASDVALTTKSTVAIAVNAVNDAPTITSNGGGATAAISVAETTTAVTTVTSADVDGGAPVYSIVAGADAAKFSINASTGVLSFITAPDFEVPTDAGGNNVYDVTVQVSDGNGGVDTQALAVTVTDVSGTLVVTTTADTNDTGLGSSFTIAQLNASRGADGQISLREALIAANNTPGLDTVSFNIGAASAVNGVYTIQVLSALPEIVDAVLIDGWSQAGYSNRPVIELSGAGASTGNGLSLGFGSSGSTVQGLIINRFTSSGIHVQDTSNVTFRGNWIGLDATGTAAAANGGNGIFMENVIGAVVGGGGAANRNVISGNGADGIFARTVRNSTFSGNYVGTSADGMQDVNGTAINYGQSGITLSWFSQYNVVGGTTADARNVLSGNNNLGLVIGDPNSIHNVAQGNYIGLAADGLTALGNSNGGMSFWGAGPNNLLGGVVPGAANVISGNFSNGVYVGNASNGAVIQGNIIGLAADGVTAVGNGYAGVAMSFGAVNSLVGSNADGVNDAAERNIISANSDAGVLVANASAQFNTISGNYIGTDISGTLDRGNRGNGVWVGDGASNNLVGGTAAGSGNLIAFSGISGISTSDAGTGGNAFLGNSVFGNVSLGIDLGWNGLTLNDLGDVDTGPNQYQNFPVLASARSDGLGQLIVSGTLNGSANSFFRIEFFASSTQDASGYGEGQRYLGFANVSTDAAGNATINSTLTATVAVGEFISATATLSNASFSSFADTSEFARNIAATSASQATITVTTTSDVSDGDTSSIGALLAHMGSDGVVSLREAILAANNTSNGTGADRIVFNVGASLTWGEHRIVITSVLPTITDAVVIDGSSEPDFVANGSRPVVAVDGNGLAADGLVLDAGSSGSTVRGLIVRGFDDSGVVVRSASQGNLIVGNYIGRLTSAGTDVGAGRGNNAAGVYLQGANNTVGGTTVADRNVISGNGSFGISIANGVATGNVVQGNYIGTTAAGDQALGNSGQGVSLSVGAVGNRIGGTAAGAGNVISGNAGTGVVVEFSASGTQIVGNRIGTDVTGQYAVANQGEGVLISGAQGTVVGGANAGNLISGNAFDGIWILGSASGTVVQGNYIGTNVAGTAPISNATYSGIWISGASTNTLIGGTAAGLGNVIAFNGADGITLEDSGGTPTGVAILGNRIFGNAGLGIDLSHNGVSTNDLGDADGGANHTQNFPTLSSANTLAGTTTLAGVLNSNANTRYRIEFFSTSTADASGHGQAQVFLGYTTVNTDAAGNASFAVALSGANVPVGHLVSATATVDLGVGVYGGTSEFSANISVTSNSANVVVGPVNPVSGSTTEAGGTASFTLALATAPLADVVFTFASSKPGEGVVTVTTLTFTSSNWSQPQTVTVAGVNDTASDGDIAYTITATASSSDAAYNGAIATVNLRNLDDDHAPEIGLPPALFAQEDQALAIAGVTVADRDGNLVSTQLTVMHGKLTLDVSVGAALSAGAMGSTSLTLTGTATQINAALATLSYQGDLDFNGVDGLTVRAVDAQGAATERSVSIVVAAVNDAPRLTSHGGAAAVALTVEAGGATAITTITTITASDVDLPAQTLRFSIVGGADAVRFGVDAQTGALRFVTAPQFASPTDANGDNVYDVVVQVSDGAGGVVTQSLAVTVKPPATEPPSANAPVITSDGGLATAVVSVQENTSRVTTVQASDADADAQLRYSIVGGVDAARFAIDAISGQLRFVVVPDFEQPLDADRNNDYDVVVQVSDGYRHAQQQLTVTVQDANEAPQPATLLLRVEEGGAGTVDAVRAAVDADAGPAGEIDRSGVVLVSAPVHGTVVVMTDGSFSYQHDGGESTSDSFSYTLRDALGAVSDVAVVRVAITPVNDAPRVVVTPALNVTGRQPVVLSTADWRVADEDSGAGALGFVISALHHGRFEYLQAPGVAIAQFSGADVAQGQVQFVATSDVDAPSFQVAAFDGQRLSAATDARVQWSRAVPTTTPDVDAPVSSPDSSPITSQITSPPAAPVGPAPPVAAPAPSPAPVVVTTPPPAVSPAPVTTPAPPTSGNSTETSSTLLPGAETHTGQGKLGQETGGSTAGSTGGTAGGAAGGTAGGNAGGNNKHDSPSSGASADQPAASRSPSAATIVANSAALVSVGGSVNVPGVPNAQANAAPAAAPTAANVVPGTVGAAGAVANSTSVNNELADTDIGRAASPLGSLRVQLAQDSRQSRGWSQAAADVGVAQQASDAARVTSPGIDAVETAQATGLALTAGTVWWALRAGGLMASLAVSLPAWRHADVLAVLPDEEDADWDLAEDDESARDEDALRQMLAPMAEGETS